MELLTLCTPHLILSDQRYISRGRGLADDNQTSHCPPCISRNQPVTRWSFKYSYLLLDAKSLLAEEHLAQQDLAILASLEFLSLCVSAEFIHGLSFRPVEVRRRLLLLLEQIDCTKPLHLNMVSDQDCVVGSMLHS